MALLEMRNITKNFKGLRVLHEVDMTVRRGEIFGLIGPNGAGKTTLFSIITGFLRPTEGEVFFKDRLVSGLKPNRIAGLGIGRVFQHSSFFPTLGVKENVEVARHLRVAGDILGVLLNTRGFRQRTKDLDLKAMGILDFVGLAERWGTPARNLPYGEQRELELAMALAAEPELLLLDEPATGMNPKETGRLMDLIREIQSRGITPSSYGLLIHNTGLDYL